MNQLTSLITTSHIGNIVLLHYTIEYDSLADIVSSSILSSQPPAHKISFTADRFFDCEQITEATSSGSLFDEYTIIRLNFATKPNTLQQKSLIPILKSLDKNTFLLICCDKLTKTEQKSEWAKFITQNGIMLEISENQIVPIIKDLFNWQDLSITTDALNALINQNQGNISQLVQETKLLILSVTDNKTIDINKIQEITTTNAQYNIYQLSKSYLSGDLKESIKILDNLYQAPEDAILISWVIHEDIKRLLKIKNKLRTQNNIQNIIRELGLWGESVAKLPIAEKRLSYNQLIKIYHQLAELDMSIKGVKNHDLYLMLQQIIITLCNT